MPQIPSTQSRFQDFSDHRDPAAAAPRLAALRARLKALGIDGFIIPRADQHQNEYVPPCDERLAWLTGFTGSAGTALVLADRAAIFVDGRYSLQVRDDVDVALFAPQQVGETSPEAWLEVHLTPGMVLGYDPWLHTEGQVKRLEAALDKAGARLKALEPNPLDALWQDRPPAPMGMMVVQPTRLAGPGVAEKLALIRSKLPNASGLLISDPHNLCWAFNLRGADIAFTPLALAYGYIPPEGKPVIFCDAAKISSGLSKALAGLATFAAPAALPALLDELGQRAMAVRLDQATAAQALVKRLSSAGGKAEVGHDPITLLKATKSAAELAGMRRAHLRDGIAMVHFLCWFDKAVRSGRLTEIDAALALEEFRREGGQLRDLSFPTISAAGPHAAIPHYRVSEASNIAISPGLFLIDSGGQYRDGTTDITRTIAVGRPGRAMRTCFTRVLQGHIALARAVFPHGTSGAQLDALARLPLWREGLDFDHGTGHGVGAYLSVHEGPQRISKMGHVALQAGMILSNEPGYYRAHEFGIRIENLVVVVDVKVKNGERPMLGFETLSFAPIDRRAIEFSLLEHHEIDWLNDYHATVRQRLLPQINNHAKKWLEAATSPFLY
ncbi:MAG: M24 family metallopeptidase [Hyphomicrobiales bacterium]|nr:M24 family metallopeptidase [Hyphomicrobiales bacterium]